MKSLGSIAVFYLLLPVFFLACSTSKQSSDLIIYNAKIYAVDSTFATYQAIAVKDGKVQELGSTEYIQNNYAAKVSFNADGKFIFPGFIDAHCHFYGYGKGLQEVDLVGTKSYNEVIERVAKFNSFNPEEPSTKNANQSTDWIIGRGWDQNDWEIKEYPDNKKLDSLFPDKPVLLERIDGHAAIVNSYALQLAKFNASTKIKGGELIAKSGKLTGVLVDNAVDSIKKLIPKTDFEKTKRSLLAAQKNCFEMGLTTVDDAGLEYEIVEAIKKLNDSGELKMRIYAMLSPSNENLDKYLKSGPFKTDRLNVCSFKFYGDGALGSRGACLCDEYADKKNWKGFLLNDISYFDKFAKQISESDFQMNTHCIGDSAGKVILSIYDKYLKGKKNKRWRIEHAQVLDSTSFAFFNDNILPSVQPTHATSDMYWAVDRIGARRLKNAYAYKKLLKQCGSIPLGTDFPVEDISPFKTFYAAVVRKDAKGFPEGGFQTENALTREETIRGMTIWAAFANFEEKEKGSLEKGKFADLVILDTDLMNCPEKDILNTRVLYTYLNGEKVFGVNTN